MRSRGRVQVFVGGREGSGLRAKKDGRFPGRKTAVESEGAPWSGAAGYLRGMRLLLLMPESRSPTLR